MFKKCKFYVKKFLTKIFSNKNDKFIKILQKTVHLINKIEPQIKQLNDKQLKNKTIEFRKLIKNGIKINDLLIEAFAVVREASIRVMNMRHFDVQLLGGIVLNKNCIAEMCTGEGKTLTSTLPAYLNALSGEGVHIITVNDYLAKRDAKENSPLFEFLGLTVGVNLPGLSILEKQNAYSSDITYGTNNEYVFDYLRDNMEFNYKNLVQPNKLNYALIDEVDSILIDESRTPLVISGFNNTTNFNNLYYTINKLVLFLIKQNKKKCENNFNKGHFIIDKSSRQIFLTESGLILVEELLIEFNILKKKHSLFLTKNTIIIHYILSALRAHIFFIKDIDYILKNNKIIIVDEHTGRFMHDRRWSDHLHQAIEAKENLKIQKENQALASITFQNYFRLYKKLSGMTGTASTESFEFKSIYKLNTITIPTNLPMIRNDLPDLIFVTNKEKIEAIINDIKNCIKRNQPVLVGTISIEKSELISSKLNKLNISHKVLNAKFHEMEAEIIAQAGQPGAVTIATNMAGRGTDIILGGNWKSKINKQKLNQFQIQKIKNKWKIKHAIVIAAGGLHIIGTERHESRRIDNQLRGRAGRQGDIGSSRFYLSMEDNLINMFISNNTTNLIRKLGIKYGEAIEHPWVSQAIANAQYKVENRNFNIRKQLLEFDDISNDQRQIIYSLRNTLLYLKNNNEVIQNIRNNVLPIIFNTYIPNNYYSNDDLLNLNKHLKDNFNFNFSIKNTTINTILLNKNYLYTEILKQMVNHYNDKKKIIGNKIIHNLEKNIILHTLDKSWQEHLIAMDYLRQGINLRYYAQKNPNLEYKLESFNLFKNMLKSLKYKILSNLSKF